MSHVKKSQKSKKEVHCSFNPLGSYPAFTGLKAAGAIHKVIGQGTVPAALVANSVSPQYYSRYFVGGDLDNFSSLSAVFDQYRITKIDVWFVPSVTNNTDGTQTVSDLYTAVDIDDASTPTALNQLFQYESVIATKALTGHHHSWSPQLSVGAYGSTGFIQSVNERNKWIDCGSSTAQHYGIKAALSVGTLPVKYDLIFRIHAEFQSLH